MKNLIIILIFIIHSSFRNSTDLKNNKEKLETKTILNLVDTTKADTTKVDLAKAAKALEKILDHPIYYPTPNVYPNPPQIDTLYALVLDIDIECLEARQKIASDSFDITEMNMLLMKIAQCKTIEENKKKPNSPVVTVVTESVDENGNGRILFNTMSLKTGEDIAAASKKIIGICTFAKTKDPLTTVVTSAVGDYAVDSFLEAAKTNDPLIIFFPVSVPGKKLTEDVYNNITQLKAVKKVEAVFTKGVETAKNNPGVLIMPLSPVPLVEKPLKKILKKIGF